MGGYGVAAMGQPACPAGARGRRGAHDAAVAAYDDALARAEAARLAMAAARASVVALGGGIIGGAVLRDGRHRPDHRGIGGRPRNGSRGDQALPRRAWLTPEELQAGLPPRRYAQLSIMRTWTPDKRRSVAKALREGTAAADDRQEPMFGHRSRFEFVPDVSDSL